MSEEKPPETPKERPNVSVDFKWVEESLRENEPPTKD